MASMKVRVYVTLSVTPGKRHVEEMRFSASTRTDNKDSVSVFTDPDDGKTLVAEFTVPKARQMDVVDRIVQAFEDFVHDSIDFSASFPPSEAEARKAERALERAKAKRAAAREARKKTRLTAASFAGKVSRWPEGGYSHRKDGYVCSACKPCPFK